MDISIIPDLYTRIRNNLIQKNIKTIENLSKKNTAINRLKELIKIELAGDEYVRAERDSMLATINNHNHVTLYNHSQSIALPDLFY